IECLPHVSPGDVGRIGPPMPSLIARSTISSTVKSGCAGCSRWSRAAAIQTSSATLIEDLVATATVETSLSKLILNQVQMKCQTICVFRPLDGGQASRGMVH